MKSGANKYEQRQIRKAQLAGEPVEQASRKLNIDPKTVSSFYKYFESDDYAASRKGQQEALAGLNIVDARRNANDIEAVYLRLDCLEQAVFGASAEIPPVKGSRMTRMYGNENRPAKTVSGNVKAAVDKVAPSPGKKSETATTDGASK